MITDHEAALGQATSLSRGHSTRARDLTLPANTIRPTTSVNNPGTCLSEPVRAEGEDHRDALGMGFTVVYDYLGVVARLLYSQAALPR